MLRQVWKCVLMSVMPVGLDSHLWRFNRLVKPALIVILVTQTSNSLGIIAAVHLFSFVQWHLTMYSSLFPCYCNKTLTQSNLGKERFYSHYWGKLQQEAEAKIKVDSRDLLLTGLPSACFLIHLRITSQGMALPTVDRILSCQSSVKKMPLKHAYRPIR